MLLFHLFVMIWSVFHMFFMFFTDLKFWIRADKNLQRKLILLFDISKSLRPWNKVMVFQNGFNGLQLIQSFHAKIEKFHSKSVREKAHIQIFAQTENVLSFGFLTMWKSQRTLWAFFLDVCNKSTVWTQSDKAMQNATSSFTFLRQSQLCLMYEFR